MHFSKSELSSYNIMNQGLIISQNDLYLLDCSRIKQLLLILISRSRFRSSYRFARFSFYTFRWLTGMLKGLCVYLFIEAEIFSVC